MSIHLKYFFKILKKRDFYSKKEKKVELRTAQFSFPYFNRLLISHDGRACRVTLHAKARAFLEGKKKRSF